MSECVPGWLVRKFGSREEPSVKDIGKMFWSQRHMLCRNLPGCHSNKCWNSLWLTWHILALKKHMWIYICSQCLYMCLSMFTIVYLHSYMCLFAFHMCLSMHFTHHQVRLEMWQIFTPDLDITRFSSHKNCGMTVSRVSMVGHGWSCMLGCLGWTVGLKETLRRKGLHFWSRVSGEIETILSWCRLNAPFPNEGEVLAILAK